MNRLAQLISRHAPAPKPIFLRPPTATIGSEPRQTLALFKRLASQPLIRPGQVQGSRD